MATKCKVCKGDLDWEHVKEDFEDVFKQADGFGMESSTEAKQMVVEGKICSEDCFHEID